MLPFILFFAFIVVPLVELYVILQVGGVIGVPQTIALLVIDSIVGAVLVKREGRRAWDNFRLAIAEMRWPGDEVTQGALILVGGALLLTPGFVTDVVGLLAVLPPSRVLASRVIRRWVTPAPVREASKFARDAREARGRGDRRDHGRDGDDRRDARGDDRSAGPGPRGGRDRRRSRRQRDGRGEVFDVEVVSVERDEPTRGTGDRAGSHDRPPSELGGRTERTATDGGRDRGGDVGHPGAHGGGSPEGDGGGSPDGDGGESPGADGGGSTGEAPDGPHHR